MNYTLYINHKKTSDNHMAAFNEFIKRLSAYCTVSLNTALPRSLAKDLSKPDHALVIIHKGVSTYSSTDFAKYIENAQLSGISTIHVAIGFQDIEVEHAEKIALSASELNIDTTALLFLEQLYRSYTIIHGKTYHK